MQAIRPLMDLVQQQRNVKSYLKVITHRHWLNKSKATLTSQAKPDSAH